MQTTIAQQTKGIDFIIDSKRGYPGWIKGHQLFKEMRKIDKIFPRLGLPNFQEEVEIANTQEAKQFATALGNKIIVELDARKQGLNSKLQTSLLSKEKNRNETCCQIQNLVGLCDAVATSLRIKGSDGIPEYITVEKNKVDLCLRSDIFGMDEKLFFRKDENLFITPAFKKGEAVFKVLNKLKEMSGKFGIIWNSWDQWQEFKDFSRTNIGGKKQKLVFSSYGDNGVWDIATMSMRGISSCQSWGTSNSKGLIGSIASKYVAVMYLASGDQEVPGYGSKMLNRSVVRLVINDRTKKPALIIDRMYPSENKDTLRAFETALSKRSGLDVFYAPHHSGEIGNFYVPSEQWMASYLKNGETSYMDSKFNHKQHPTAIPKTTVANRSELTDKFKVKLGSDLNEVVRTKRERYKTEYAAFEKARGEYAAAKIKWAEENEQKPIDKRTEFTMPEPSLDPELKTFFRYGTENMCEHCDKKHGKNSAATMFINAIFTAIPTPKISDCSSKEEYHRRFVLSFLKEPAKIKALAWKEVCNGTWMKSFPKSSEHFFNWIFGQLKSHMLTSIKEMIRQSN